MHRIVCVYTRVYVWVSKSVRFYLAGSGCAQQLTPQQHVFRSGGLGEADLPVCGSDGEHRLEDTPPQSRGVWLGAGEPHPLIAAPQQRTGSETHGRHVGG